MLDLRDYKELVKAAIKETAEKDTNWKWKIKSCSKNTIRIWWSYLNEYLEEDETFCIKLEDLKGLSFYFLKAINPNVELIDGWEVPYDGKEEKDAYSIEYALKEAVREIIGYALKIY